MKANRIWDKQHEISVSNQTNTHTRLLQNFFFQLKRTNKTNQHTRPHTHTRYWELYLIQVIKSISKLDFFLIRNNDVYHSTNALPSLSVCVCVCHFRHSIITIVDCGLLENDDNWWKKKFDFTNYHYDHLWWLVLKSSSSSSSSWSIRWLMKIFSFSTKKNWISVKIIW